MVNFISYENTGGFVLLIVSLLAFLNEIFTNPQILYQSWSPVVYSLTQWSTQNRFQQIAASRNKTELLNFWESGIYQLKATHYFLLLLYHFQKWISKMTKRQRESLTLIQASSRQILPFSMALSLLILSNMPLFSQYSLVQ